MVFPDILNSWLNKRHELEIVSNTIVEMLCGDGATPNTILLRTLQTLEHIHGLLWPDHTRYMSRRTFIALLKSIKNRFPNEISDFSAEEMKEITTNRDIIINRMGALNGVSFRSRIEKILREVPLNKLMPIINNPIDFDKFIVDFLDNIEASRHYLTHYNVDQKEKFFKRHEIENATILCWSILIYWVSTIVGIDQNFSGAIALKSKGSLFLTRPNVKL